MADLPRDTIALVQQAWEAAPECRPTTRSPTGKGGMLIHIPNHPYPWRWRLPDLGEFFVADPTDFIDASLHRYLLSQGAWVEPRGDQRLVFVDSVIEPGTAHVIARGSLTAAMARGVLALKGVDE